MLYWWWWWCRLTRLVNDFYVKFDYECHFCLHVFTIIVLKRPLCTPCNFLVFMMILPTAAVVAATTTGGNIPTKKRRTKVKRSEWWCSSKHISYDRQPGYVRRWYYWGRTENNMTFCSNEHKKRHRNSVFHLLIIIKICGWNGPL